MVYKEAIIEAITALKDRTGSSMISIKKFCQAKLAKDKKTWQNAVFLKALKAGVASGDFVQTKNSYKLSADFKKSLIKKAKPAPKKKAAPKKKKTAPKKKTTTKKKTAPKKKKTAPKKKATSKKKTAPKKKKTAKKAKK